MKDAFLKWHKRQHRFRSDLKALKKCTQKNMNLNSKWLRRCSLSWENKGNNFFLKFLPFSYIFYCLEHRFCFTWWINSKFMFFILYSFLLPQCDYINFFFLLGKMKGIVFEITLLCTHSGIFKRNEWQRKFFVPSLFSVMYSTLFVWLMVWFGRWGFYGTSDKIFEKLKNSWGMKRGYEKCILMTVLQSVKNFVCGHAMVRSRKFFLILATSCGNDVVLCSNVTESYLHLRVQ